MARLRWALGAAVLALAVTAAALYLTGRSSPATAMQTTAPTSDLPAATWTAGARRAPAFSLVDQHGAPISLGSLRGRPVLVTFIDPLCRDYCPIEAQRLNDVVRELPAAQKPTIVAVSVNVYGNTKQILAEDERKWKVTPAWRWAIGKPAALSRVWRSYGVEVLVSTRTVAGVKLHTITHTEGSYLIDADGYERALFLWPYSAKGVAKTLRDLSS